MSQPDQSPAADAQQRRAQIRAYSAAQRGTYTDEAIRASLRQAGYPDDEIDVVLRSQENAGKPAFSSPWPAVGIGMGLAVFNLIAFPFLLVLGMYLTNSLSADAFMLLPPVALFGLELALIWALRRGRIWTTPLLLALLAPLGLHLLFFGICTVSLMNV